MLVGGAVPDMAVEYDERGPPFGLAKHRKGVLDAVDVVCIADTQDVPTIGQESGGDIFGESDLGAALYGYVVVVPDPAKVIEAEVPRERSCLRRHALHQAAVTAHRVYLVVEDLEVRPIVPIGKPLLSDAHANAGSYALAEWATGGLDA